MARRRQKADAAAARDRTMKLIDRLCDHALGTAELSATQLKAMELLLKVLPALAAAAEGEADTPVTVKGALVWKPPAT